MPAAPDRPSSPTGYRLFRAALGLFVVAQLLYLISANALGILEAYAPDAWKSRPAAAAAAVTQRWADLTGQHQTWSLFAPVVGRDFTFPAVELRWSDDREPPMLLLSDNEPADRRAFFRLGRFRLRRCEMKFDMSLPEPEAVGLAHLDGWNRDLDDKVRWEWRRYHAYLRWRLKRFARENDDGDPPDVAVLLLRRYRVPPAGEVPWDWRGPDTFPVARWTALGVAPGRLPVERYNPVVERFEPMSHGR